MVMGQDEVSRRPKERRSNQNNRATINQILFNMQDLADVGYHGMLQDNALEVFHRLTEGDQKTFLRQSLTVLWEKQIDLSKHGLHEIIVDDFHIDLQAVDAERASLAADDPLETARLRSFLFRTFFVVSFVMLFFVVGLTLFYDPTNGNLDDLIKAVTKLLEIVLGK